MSIAEQQIVIICRTQEEPIDVIEACNVLGIGWVDGEPARYFAPIHTSEPFNIVLDKAVIGYCRFRDIAELQARGFETRTAEQFVTNVDNFIIHNADKFVPGQTTAYHAFDALRDRDALDEYQ